MTATKEEMMNKTIEKLKADHNQKLIDLYNKYYDKAMEDSTCFKAFNDVSRELFKGSDESEIDNILNRFKDGDAD